jgi:hypothetical protein
MREILNEPLVIACIGFLILNLFNFSPQDSLLFMNFVFLTVITRKIRHIK